jgi:phosphomannomutase
VSNRCAGIRFGTDGWRGIIADDCTVETVRCVGRAYAAFLHEQELGRRPRVVLGFDRRFASDLFAEALADELSLAGVDVLMCRQPVPTPVVSFVITQFGADGGLMVTASHNPPRYNGVKIKTAAGASAPPELCRALEERMAQGRVVPLAQPRGNVTEVRPLDAYLERLERIASVAAIRAAGFTVIADPLYGATAGLLPQLLNGDLTKCVEVNAAHNPLFPGISGPEPVEQNLGKLQRAVVDGQATLGLAFDGDGDRLGVVDERGVYVSAQHVFALLAYYLLELRGLRGAMVRSVNGSAMLDRLAQRYGVTVIETPNGFPYLAGAMQEHRAVIAGEESGGIAVALHLPERDGLLCGLLLLDLLRQRRSPLSQVLDELRGIVGDWTYRRLDLPLPPARRDVVRSRLQGVAGPARLANLAVVDESRLDGLKLYLENGAWVLIRPSGTEPLLRVHVEAPEPELVDRLLAEARQWLGL